MVRRSWRGVSMNASAGYVTIITELLRFRALIRVDDTSRHLLQRTAWKLGRGQHDAADALLLEAGALEAALIQYERAIADARCHVDDLRQAVSNFWVKMADDRTLHDLADDAGVFMALIGELDRAESRLLTLEFTRP